MRIVISNPFYPPQVGTLATYAAGIEGAFKKKGHEVIVVPLGAVAALPKGLRHVVYFCKLLLALRGAAFVLALDTWSVGMPALFAARLMRVPFVIRIGGDFLWERYVERTQEHVRLSEFYTTPRQYSWKETMYLRGMRAIVRHAHVIFFNSRFQRDIWRKAYGFDEMSGKILENYFPARTREVVPPQNFVFVSAGRPSAVKKYGELQRAFERAKTRHPQIDLDSRTVPHNEQLDRIERSYAVIIPSISEACSNIAIESVISGRPFIITEDTGTKERLSECGLYIDTRSEEQLEKGIETMLEAAEYKKLAEKCRAFSFVHSWDDIAEEIIAAL